MSKQPTLHDQVESGGCVGKIINISDEGITVYGIYDDPGTNYSIFEWKMIFARHDFKPSAWDSERLHWNLESTLPTAFSMAKKK